MTCRRLLREPAHTGEHATGRSKTCGQPGVKSRCQGRIAHCKSWLVTRSLIPRAFSSFRLARLLNRPEVIDRSLGVASIEPEGRHVRMNGQQAVLQSIGKILVIKLAVAEVAERRVGVGGFAPSDRRRDNA